VVLASKQTTLTKLTLTQVESQVPLRDVAPPGLLRCLLVSFSDQRTELLQAAAENEAWQVVVCGDARQFARNIFRLKVPLAIVDLPKLNVAGYAELRDATTRAHDVSDAMLVVCGADGDTAEELWARQLGTWVYLPKANDPEGLEFVFREARKALAKQATSYVDTCGRLQPSPPAREPPRD